LCIIPAKLWIGEEVLGLPTPSKEIFFYLSTEPDRQPNADASMLPLLRAIDRQSYW